MSDPTTGEAIATVSRQRDQFVPVPNDHERFIPTEFVGKPIASNHYCRYWNSGREKYCGQRAGAATRHLGAGRCRRHGGGNDNAVHGIRSKYRVADQTMDERIKRHTNDPELLDMKTELGVLCGLLDELLESPEMNRTGVERLAIEAGKMKERIHNTSAKNAFSVEQMKRFWFALNRVIEMVLKDEPELCEKLQQQITLIPL